MFTDWTFNYGQIYFLKVIAEPPSLYTIAVLELLSSSVVSAL